MKFKKILVSDDNQLVIGDYGLNESDVEIIDLNKSLHDVYQDEELRNFITENIIDPEKIYIVCVKEDFGSNDQLLDDIQDIKQINKFINKAYKKVKNIYFFVYNTHMKNDGALNPTLDQPSAFSATEAKIVDNNDVAEENIAEEVTETVFDDVNNDVDAANETIEEAVVIEEQPLDAEVTAHEETVDEVTEVADDEVTEVAEQPENGVVFEEAIEAQDSEQPLTQEEINTIEAEAEANNAEIVEETVTVDEPTVEEEAVNSDVAQLNQIVGDLESLEFEQDQKIRDDIENNTVEVEQVEVTSDEIFDEKELGMDEIVEVSQDAMVNFDSVDEVAAENNEEVSAEEDRVVFNNKLDDSVDMPESYFDMENEDNISYEDYNEFVNDYELNIHTLKSIYDFIWRILVLNNHNLKLNDLLYIAVNNLDAFSIGQSDFVRQTANKAESLFDLILQLDIKLEFNNSLFYIYLAQFFSISGSKIVVNQGFLDTLSIWVDKASKRKFVEQVEQFMNYSSVYNKKIIFSYFVELANFIKGCLPTIRPNITLIDIHRILTNPSKKVRSENVFGFMVNKINQIFKDNGMVVEMYLVDTPENIFGIAETNELDANSDSWKTQLTILYKKLVENILNYILLKGNKETEIFNMYIDIKDLRMYRNLESDKNLLSPQTVDALAQIHTTYDYATIGDAMNREKTIVPGQVSNDASLSEQYLSGIERGMNLNGMYGSNEFVNHSIPSYPDNVVLTANNSNIENLRSKYAAKFNMAEFETSMSRRIEEYEKKIKDNIARIEAERKQLKQKMEDLKNI